jgi:hypothetical protein
VKKLLLLLTLSFLSSSSLAKVGDTYLCEEKNAITIVHGLDYFYAGENSFETFIFEKKKDKIVFKNFTFASSIPINFSKHEEDFRGGNRKVGVFDYQEKNALYNIGNFSYVAQGPSSVRVIMAECQIIK